MTPGEAAYTTWCSAHKTMKLLPWEKLHKNVRNIWDTIAANAVECAMKKTLRKEIDAKKVKATR